MASVLQSSGDAGQLEQLTTGGFTIFVPVDDAWDNSTLALTNDSATAKSILSDHVSAATSVMEDG